MYRWVGRLLAVLVLTAAAVGASIRPVAAETVQVSIGVGDTILSIQGQASPHALVSAARNSSTLGTTVADASGAFTLTLPAQDPGIQTYHVSADSQSNVHTDMVQMTVNITEHATTTVSVFLPSTIEVTPLEPAYGKPVVLRGETMPNADVLVYVDNAIFETVVADAAGRWQVKIDTNTLSSGGHQVFAQVVNGLGEQSYPTAARTIVVATEPVPSDPAAQPPSGSPIGRPATPEPPVITSPTPNQSWGSSTIIVRGTAPAGTQIELWNGDRIVGSVWANSLGEWSLLMYLQPTGYDLRARACWLGTCSAFSAPIYFQPKPEPGITKAPLDVRLPQSMLTGKQGEPVELRAIIQDGTAPYTVAVYWGDGTQSDVTISGKLILQSHRYEAPGNYAVRVFVTDSTGRTNTVWYTIAIEGSGQWLTPLALTSTTLAGVAAVFWFVIWRRRHRNAVAKQPAKRRAPPRKKPAKSRRKKVPSA